MQIVESRSETHEKPEDLIESPEIAKRKKTDETTSLMIEATK